MSGSITSAEGELNAIIKEYLESLKLDETLQAFEEECRKKGKPIQEHAGRRDEKVLKIQKELLHHFDRGERLEFFSCWETHINSDVIDEDAYSQKLEFMLHVHFAVHPLRKADHWVQEDVEQSMFQLRYYLETRGSFLSSCPDLLPFFALPYVQQPSSHPSFSHVFQDCWVTELRKKLETFLWEHLQNKLNEDFSAPRLVDLYNNNDFDLKEAKTELKLMERRLEESQKCYINQSKKLDKLQEDCQHLMSTASLLVNALESAVKGDFIDLDCVLSSCAERFPEAYRLKNNDAVISYKETDKHPVGTSTLTVPRSDDINNNQLPPAEFPLNFNKVIKDLCEGEERNQLLLLQALRWRLTKADFWSQREKTISIFIENDLLGLKDVSTHQPLFVHIMRAFSVNLRQSISRLLNAFASFSQGREYLSQCPELIQALMDNLLVFKSKDNVIRDMTLGTLQKLSMRSVCQILMIEAGMMEWLTETLERPKKLSDYRLEYSVALLMNLCLCPTGKTRCETIKEKLLQLLRNLLLVGNKNIIGYVNGALYSILSIPVVKKYAIQQNLEETLVNVMKNSEPEVKKQLECIQELLHAEQEGNSCSSEEDTDDEEEVDLEPELDLDDPVSALPGEFCGELLLWKNYSLPNQEEETKSGPMTENTKYERLFKSNSSFNDMSPSRKVQCSGSGQGISSAVSAHRSNSVPLNSNPPGPPPQLESPAKGHPASEPVTPKLDLEATQLVRKIVGQPSTTLVEAAIVANPASVNIKGLNANEYMVAFSSRPKIPRTPELSASGSKHGKSQSPSSPNMDALCLANWETESLIDYSRMSPKVSASSPISSPHYSERRMVARKKNE